MIWLNKILLLLITIFAVNRISFTQYHFVFTQNTGNNAIVAITTQTNPNINGETLAIGDEIGVFTPDGLCVGAIIWQNKNDAITIWGDNELTQQIDGIRIGEEFIFRVWKKNKNLEINNVSVSYSQGNGYYIINGINILSSLSAVISNIPNLTENSSKFVFRGSYPNPMALSSIINFDLQEEANVQIIIYDCIGREVQKITHNRFSAGSHSIIDNVNHLTNGTYFLSIIVNTINNNEIIKVSKKILVLK